ncbi:MAG TPA: DUF402 domain-containing protein [Longimicrobiales bacterium]|nr:DUF402 domain-containing protein [Longimicrobiales bacterium]
MSRTIAVHYHRPPDRNDIYIQEVLYEDDDVTVSLLPARAVHGPIIWFTFTGLKYDVGRFHTPAGVFTGIYCDIIRPLVRRNKDEIEIVDLFVDIWIADGAPPTIQDVDELEDAVRQGWIDRATADDALREAERLVAEHTQGNWPPAIVNEWPISRVRGNS